MSTIIATTLQTTNLSDGTDTIPATYVTGGSAKSWVYFNGTSTVSILDSFNISSLTDAGTGQYDFTLTNAHTDADWGGFCSLYSSSFIGIEHTGAGTYQIRTYNNSTTNADRESVSAMTIGDLA
jgi:hypothetical protein